MTRDDGGARTVPAQRVALLAVLIAAGDRGLSRDRTAALLWPDSSDDNARHSLGQSLYALRRDGGSVEVVVGGTTTLRLNPEVVGCDAWALDAAARNGDHARVVDLYTGPFLDGIHLRGSAELDQLVDAERARLARVYASSVESLARAASRDGNPVGGANWWRQLAATDPLSSRVALELVRALVAAGDRTAALQAARIHETLVRQELDAAPDPAFTTFVDALARTRTLDAPAHHVADGSGHGVLVAPSATSLDTLAPNATPVGGSRGSRRFTWGAIAAAALLALLLGAKQFFRTSAALDTKRAYVARFENRTGDASLDPVGTMASDWVAQGLEQTGLIVVATAARAEDARSRRAVPDSRLGAPDAAREAIELGVGTLVSGAYYRLANRLRFHIQITDVASGEVLDAFDAFGDTAADPAATLEIVRQRTLGSVASSVDPRLSSWARVASKPPSFEAYREFVSGQSIWGSDHRQALGHFLRAAELDSTFYAARVEAAILHRLLGECGRTEAIARELGPASDHLAPYEYHVLDAQVAQCDGDWERAYRQARAVVDLRPRSAFLEYSLALQAMQLGRYGEAKQLMDHHALERGVVEVGPNYAVVYAQVVSALGQRERGLDVVRWVRARYPSYARAWAMEVTLLARTGRVHATERFIDTMVAQPVTQSSVRVNALRRAAASFTLAGDTAAARRTLTRALEIGVRPEFRPEALSRTPDPSRNSSLTPISDRAQLLYEVGRFDEAHALFTELASADSTNVDALGYLGLLAAQRRDMAATTAIDGSLEALRPAYTFTRTLYRSRIAALLGDRDRALRLLSSGLDEAGRFLLPAIREYGEFASIRDDERFRQLTSLR